MIPSILPLLLFSVLAKASPGKRATTAPAYCSNSDGNYKLSPIVTGIVRIRLCLDLTWATVEMPWLRFWLRLSHFSRVWRFLVHLGVPLGV